jgi:signal transduction histidine kinase
VEELRSLVGILRESGTGESAAVVPSLARAEELVADVRGAGLPVDLEVVGEPVELPRALDVSGYRILQEALTNVLRHATGASTRVTVTYGADAIELLVVNGAAARHPATVGGGPDQAPGGHGLVGMRERAGIFGGTLEAAPTADGFRVHVRLPLTGRWR